MKITLHPPAGRLPFASSTSRSYSCIERRSFHNSLPRCAVPHPSTAPGPPPKAPVPAPEFGERVERRKKQAELIQRVKEVRTQPSKPSPTLKRRFWKDVHVKKVDEGYQVLLDSRPVRTPAKTILTIPHSKPHLAEAIALEWDLLTSAQQALKQHLIPLTSLAARAEDIARADKRSESKLRKEISTTVMRYLDTDTILCWVPEKGTQKSTLNDMASADPDNSLRAKQIQLASEIIGYLTHYIWPGISIKPVLDTNSIIPESQSETTLQVIRGWIHGLPAYELAALERAVLASKSFLIAARLVVDWSENFRALRPEAAIRFGVDQAAAASTLEVTHQTDIWGEVEDTHDVDKEDLRRQLGSAILLVTGESKG